MCQELIWFMQESGNSFYEETRENATAQTPYCGVVQCCVFPWRKRISEWKLLAGFRIKIMPDVFSPFRRYQDTHRRS